MAGRDHKKRRIGILALQGAVSEHRDIVEHLGAVGIEVKKAEQLEQVDGLIIPGGESTAFGKLVHATDMFQPLQTRIQQGLPVMGTCAGLIFLAKQIVGQDQSYLKALDVVVQRNAFGRQKESFEQAISVKGMSQPFPAVFIRAPLIRSVGPKVDVLATIDQAIVAVKQDHLLGLSFHPELTDDYRFHQLFLEMVEK